MCITATPSDQRQAGYAVWGSVAFLELDGGAHSKHRLWVVVVILLTGGNIIFYGHLDGLLDMENRGVVVGEEAD